MKVELVWGYFEARETNPMDVGSRKTQWLYGDVKWIYRIAPQLQVFGKVGGEKGRLTYGWGIDIATAWSGVLSGEYQREQIDARKPDNRFMLKFSIALWGPAHQKSAELPPLFDDKGQTIAPRDLPTDLSYVGAVNTVKTPREGLTFADLMPVQGTDITYITVWGNAVTKTVKKEVKDHPTNIGDPEATNGGTTALMIKAWTFSDSDGIVAGSVGVILYNASGVEMFRGLGSSVVFSWLSPFTQYQVATFWKANVKNPDGTLIPVEKIGTKISVKTLKNDTSASASGWDLVTKTATTATMTSGVIRDIDGVRNVRYELKKWSTVIANGTLPLNAWWTENIIQNLSFTWLDSGTTYDLVISGETFRPNIWPNGTWEPVSVFWRFSTD